MATIKDISALCGMSQATISRVLKNDKSLQISDVSRQKVISAAKELGYVNKKKIKGVNVAIINWYSHDQELIDPYYYYIRKSVEKELASKSIEYKSYFKEDNLLGISSVDAVIAIGKFNLNQASQFEKISENIVFIDSNPCREIYNSVEVDFVGMISQVSDYIKSINVSSVGLLTGLEKIDGVNYKDPRTELFIKQMKAAKLLKDKHVIEDEFSLESGFNMFEKLFATGDVPELIFCGNDLIAMGANKSAYNNNLEVGKNIKIMGVNNISVTKYMVPSLTTIEIFQEQMGIEAVNVAVGLLETKSKVPKVILLPTKLKIRKST